MKKAVVVMSKIPVPGQTKTRLQAKLLAEECAFFHRACLRDILQIVHSTGIPAYLYWAGEYGKNGEFYAKHFCQRQQQGNNLGERMSNIMEEVLAEHDAVIILGSDIPEVTREDLEEAFTMLLSSDIVLGPAADGGYYLLGLKKPCPELFSHIPWGTSTVLRKTIEALNGKNLMCSFLEKKRDIDEWEDLVMFVSGRHNKEKYRKLHSYRYAETLMEKYAAQEVLIDEGKN